MSDKEFNKLLDDDSQSEMEVRQQRRKRKTRDVVRLPRLKFLVYYSSFKYIC